jgi:oxygen-independent coproporphyrinogen-3 oxidase
VIEPVAAYLHIPFCDRLCPYCDFAVVTGRGSDTDRYIDAVVSEILADRPAAPLRTVFIGGGTPSSISASSIERLLGALSRQHGLADPEVTLESNPEHLAQDLVTSLASVGVNRLSMGAQSFDPVVLRALGRRHRPEDIDVGVAAARAAGMASVSLDLIFGHPAETDASWEATLERAIGLDVDHVSTYALTVERGTALSRSIAEGAPAPDDDVQADRYEVAVDRLGRAGFEHYEVSNHGRPGHRCDYNTEVWAGRPYLAYGLGAHGFRDGTRFRNVRAFDAYVTRVESGGSPRQGVDPIDPWEQEVDRFMIGLRIRDGVELGEAGPAFLDTDSGRRLVLRGILEVDGAMARVVDPLLTDAVAREVVGLSPPR